MHYSNGVVVAFCYRRKMLHLLIGTGFGGRGGGGITYPPFFLVISEFYFTESCNDNLTVIKVDMSSSYRISSLTCGDRIPVIYRIESPDNTYNNLVISFSFWSFVVL